MLDVAWSPDGTRLIAVTRSGSVIQVTGNNAHSTVYKINTAVRLITIAAPSLLISVQLCGCAFSSRGIVAIGVDREVTLLDASNDYSVIETFNGLSHVRL